MARLPKRPRAHVLETESENFARRILPSEWVTERKEHDYSVDLQVEIVKDEGVTGARFSIQLKSTDSLKVRKKTYIAHPCASSALFYYLQLPEPVIYLVYDAKEGKGYWVWIQEYLRSTEMDPSWKSKDEVTVRIPKENSFDSWAVKQIAEKVLDRHDQARWMQAIQTANNPYYKYTFAATEQEFAIGIYPRYPGAERDSPITFSGTFKFDQSEDGRAALEAFDKSIKTGAPVRIDSRFFEGFDLPSAHPELFAHVDGFSLETIELLPITVARTIPSRVLALDDQRMVLGELPYVEFRQMQSGTEETTYSNEQQDIPIKMTHVVNNVSRKRSFSIQTLFLNQNVADIQESLNMHRALNRATYLKVVDLSTRQFSEIDISDKRVQDINHYFVSLIDDLALIQERMKVPLVWPGKITAPEIAAILKMASALRTGSYEEPASIVTTTIDKSTIQKLIAAKDQSQKMQLSLDFDDTTWSILGNKFSLGPGKLVFPKVRFKMSIAKVLKKLSNLPDDAPMRLQFVAEEPGIAQVLQLET